MDTCPALASEYMPQKLQPFPAPPKTRLFSVKTKTRFINKKGRLYVFTPGKLNFCTTHSYHPCIVKIMLKKFAHACSSARSSEHHVINACLILMQDAGSCRVARDAMAAAI
jgi:hypothetical protein